MLSEAAYEPIRDSFVNFESVIGCDPCCWNFVGYEFWPDASR